MKRIKQLTQLPLGLQHYTRLLLVVWTVIIGASLTWNLYRMKDDLEQRARTEARGSSDKDLLLQRWIAKQGGIYAAVSEDIQPSPHLSTVEDRDVETASGKRLTLMNAAFVMRRLYSSSQAGEVHGHFTSLKPLHPDNTPDSWEKEVLGAFEAGAPEVSSVEMLNGEPYMRFMRPMVTEERCLKCHSEQGYKVGDIRGGFSVSIPMAPYLEQAWVLGLPLFLGHGAIWIVGLGGIGLASGKIRRGIDEANKEAAERKRAEEELRASYQQLHASNQQLAAGEQQLRASNQQLVASEQQLRASNQQLVAGEQQLRASTRQLQVSEEKYRSLIANIPDVVWTTDHEGHTTFITSNVETVYGYTPQEIYEGGELLWFERIHPDDVQRVKNAFDAIFEEQGQLDLEYRIRRKDGEWIWLRDRSIGAYEKDGVKYADGVFFDITERKRSIEDLERVFNLSGYMVCVASLDGYFLKISPAFEEVLGYTSEELLARPFVDFIHPDDKDKTDAVVERELAAGKEVIGFENRYRCKDGTYKWLGWTSRPVIEEGIMFAIAHDITERKRAENTLQESVVKYRALFEAPVDAIFIIELTESGLAIVDCNSSTADLFGCTREEMLGRSPVDFSPEVQPDGSASADKAERIIAAFAASEPQRFEWAHRRLDGTLFDAEVSLTPVKLGDKLYMQAIVRDITERKRLEERERQHQEQIAHVSRLTVAGELASGLAHELNQPLTAISNYAQACRNMIESGKADSPRVLDATKGICAQAIRGGEIIRRMRDFVRKQSPVRSPGDFNEIVRDAVDLVKAQARQSEVTLQLELADEPLPVQVDKIQIEQVIVNLMQNGFEAMAEVEPCDRVLAVRTARTETGMVEVAVEDRGTGLSEENSRRLFEPFFTTKSKGLGIGLSISRSIIEGHQGRIWATPNPQKGTTFAFTLLLE